MSDSPQNSRLTADTTAKIRTLLAAQIGIGLTDRQAVLIGAFGGGSPIVRIVDCNGTPDTFAAHLIDKLLSYGTTEDGKTRRQSPALAVLLRSLNVGVDVAARLNGLAETVEAAGRHSAEAGNRSTPSASTAWVDTALPKPKAGAPLVFLCHGKEDKAYVRLLYRRLVRDGYYPWLDEVELKPYDLWEKEIYDAIARSERFILCLSTNTTGERFFQKEIANALTIAEARGLETRYILPIRWDDCDIPDRFSSRNVTALFPCDPKARTLNEMGYANLLKALPDLKRKPAAAPKAVVRPPDIVHPPAFDFAAFWRRHLPGLRRFTVGLAAMALVIGLISGAVQLYSAVSTQIQQEAARQRQIADDARKQKEADDAAAAKKIADAADAAKIADDARKQKEADDAAAKKKADDAAAAKKKAENYFDSGIAYDNLKQYDKAIADYNEAIRLDPKLALAYNNRGSAYDDLKQYDKAIADYNEAIRLDPKLALAYNNRGSAYDDLKQYDKAIADYTEAIRLDPKYAVAYYNRGYAYYNLKQYDKAIADYTEAIRLDPKDADAYYNRGSAYDDLKQYDKAIADYNEAIRLDPKYADAYINRGLAYYYLKQYDKAIADYEKYLERAPDADDAATARARIAELRKRL